MDQINSEAARSASNKTNATSSAREVGTLSDGYLSVRFLARPDGSPNEIYAQPTQQYEIDEDRTIKTSAIHQDDLFRMAMLLMKASGYISTLKAQPAADRNAGS